MKIKINSSGQVVSIEDYLLVQNANFLNTNNITLEFNEDFSVEQLNSFYTARLTVELADGRTLYNLAMPKSISDGQVRFIHEVTNDSQIFSVNGSLSISIQVLSSSNGVLATVKSRAVVQENTGISNAEEYDTALAEIDATLVQPLEARINNNLNVINNSKWGLKNENFIYASGNLDTLSNGCYFANAGVNSNAPVSGYLYCVGSSPSFQVLFGQDSYVYLRYTSYDSSYGDYVWGDWRKSANQFDVNTLQSQITELSNRVNSLVIGGQTDIFVIVDELPEEGLANKIYLVPIADGETPNVFDEYLWVYTHWEYFGRSSLNVDLSEYVKFTDYATADKAGVLKLGAGLAVSPSTNSTFVKGATNTQIDAKVTSYYPIAPSTLDYAIKVGLTTNINQLTDEEKTSACEWLGAIRKSYVDSIGSNWENINITIGNNNIFSPNGDTWLPEILEFSVKYNKHLKLIAVQGRLKIKSTIQWNGIPKLRLKRSILENALGTFSLPTTPVPVAIKPLSGGFVLNEGSLMQDNTIDYIDFTLIDPNENLRQAGEIIFHINVTVPYKAVITN